MHAAILGHRRPPGLADDRISKERRRCPRPYRRLPRRLSARLLPGRRLAPEQCTRDVVDPAVLVRLGDEGFAGAVEIGLGGDDLRDALVRNHARETVAADETDI